MHYFKKTIILWVIFSLFSIHFPYLCLARQNSFNRVAEEKNITKHSPNCQKSPEEEIPVETVQKRKSNKWLWVGLGVLAAGVLAGAGGGGGDDGSRGEEDNTSIKIEW